MKNSWSMKLWWILLGLLMLVPGLMKLFVVKPAAVVGMLSAWTLFSWAPTFWAWLLILSEIVFGVLILARYKLKYTTIPPMIILLVAGLGNFSTSNLTGLIFHLLAVVGYWGLMESAK